MYQCQDRRDPVRYTFVHLTKTPRKEQKKKQAKNVIKEVSLVPLTFARNQAFQIQEKNSFPDHRTHYTSRQSSYILNSNVLTSGNSFTGTKTFSDSVIVGPTGSGKLNKGRSEPLL